MGALIGLGLVVAGCHLGRTNCAGTGCAWSSDDWARAASLANLPAAAPPDPSNHYCDDPRAAELGRQFYFDARFSGPATLVDSIGRPVAAARAAKGQPTNLSCASCHDPAHAGTDDTSMPNTLSIGAGIYDVNGQQTANAAFYPLLYWNGRSDSLWSQAMAVNESGFSMNGTRLQTFWTIVQYYLPAYNAVFGDARFPLPDRISTADFHPTGKPAASKPADCTGSTDYYDCTLDDTRRAIVDQVFVNFGKAIACYEALLGSTNAPFDRFVNAGPGSGVISAAAERGAMLFVGKASCVDCHNGPMLSDGKFHNIGVPQSGEHVPTLADCPASPADAGCVCVPGSEGSTCEPAGAWAGAKKLAGETEAAHVEANFRRDSIWSDAPDAGEPFATTLIGPVPDGGSDSDPDPSLKGAWRTPSLRDVAITAPYMHDGYYQTLTQVVQHYNMGGVAGAGNTFQLPVCGAQDAGPCMAADAGQSVPHLAAEIKPLDLTDEEMADLVAFLQTLTGEPTNPGVISAPALPATSGLDGSLADGGVVLNPGGDPLDAGVTP